MAFVFAQAYIAGHSVSLFSGKDIALNDHERLAFVPRLIGTAVITALLSTIAAPAFASSPTTPTPSPFSAAALAKAVKSTPAPVAATAVAAAPAKAPAKARQASGSFIKSKVGVLVVAVFAVGTGYAIYSAREDRVRGLNR
jgi:hypothetical protein